MKSRLKLRTELHAEVKHKRVAKHVLRIFVRHKVHVSKFSAMAWQRMAKVLQNLYLLLDHEQFTAERPVFCLQFGNSSSDDGRLWGTILFLPIAQIPNVNTQFGGDRPGW
ncbi:MAG: hypothetical protein DME26_21915, partial [Verrucomicrobia bacterium]